MEYLNFELMIVDRGEGNYRARIVHSPGGNANVDFELPLNKLELEEFLMRLRKPKHSEAEVAAARDFGGSLFDAIFDAEMRGVLRTSMAAADQAGKGLRLRLRFADEAAELGDLPWELLYYESLNRFLVLSNETPVVRYLEMPERIEPLAAEPPLRILVMISAPSDQVQLDVEREWENVHRALSKLVDDGLVKFERLDDATLSALQQQLRREDYHVFHFIGHGEFERKSGDGELLFENSDGTSRAVSGTELGTMLSGRSLRLAVLNACEGGRASRTNQFGGAAQSLVQQGIPAVVAQQFKVSDGAAIALAREFYGAIADGYPVDGAITEGRKAVYALGDNVEWGTPVIYMRSPNGQIFDLDKEEQEMTDDKDKKEERGGQEFNISIGGDASGDLNVAGGDINKTEIGSVGGDHVGGDQIIEGDKVGGDKISVGNIEGSTGVAIGRGSSATVDQSQTTITTPFDEARKRLDEMGLPESDKEDAEYALKKIEQEAEKEQGGEEVNEDKIDRYLGIVEDVAPEAVEVLINAITNPGAAVGSGIRVAVKAWRRARKS